MRPGPRGKHDHPVGEEDRLLHRVRDEQDGRRRARGDREELEVQALAGQLVERAERLVEEEHRGSRASVRASAARWRMPPESWRRDLGRGRLEPDRLEQPRDARTACRRSMPASSSG
jgi:hypothetical protein